MVLDGDILVETAIDVKVIKVSGARIDQKLKVVLHAGAHGRIDHPGRCIEIGEHGFHEFEALCCGHGGRVGQVALQGFHGKLFLFDGTAKDEGILGRQLDGLNDELGVFEVGRVGRQEPNAPALVGGHGEVVHSLFGNLFLGDVESQRVSHQQVADVEGFRELLRQVRSPDKVVQGLVSVKLLGHGIAIVFACMGPKDAFVSTARYQ